MLLWTGILAGPLAWAIDLEASYALVKWSCATHRSDALQLITVGALALTGAGAAVAWAAWRRTVREGGHEGRREQRARFMAVLGLTSSALFAITIVAGAVPHWMLDACQ